MPANRNLLPSIFNRLRERKFRVTAKRERILGALATFDRPAGAEEIRSSARLPPSDLVTVYRSLEAFERVGVLQRVPLENGKHLFELTQPDEHFHHLVCRNCHRAERIEFCLRDQLEQEAKSRGFTDIAHVIEIYGLCDQCAAAGAKS